MSILQTLPAIHSIEIICQWCNLSELARLLTTSMNERAHIVQHFIPSPAFSFPNTTRTSQIFFTCKHGIKVQEITLWLKLLRFDDIRMKLINLRTDFHTLTLNGQRDGIKKLQPFGFVLSLLDNSRHTLRNLSVVDLREEFLFKNMCTGTLQELTSLTLRDVKFYHNAASWTKLSTCCRLLQQLTIDTCADFKKVSEHVGAMVQNNPELKHITFNLNEFAVSQLVYGPLSNLTNLCDLTIHAEHGSFPLAYANTLLTNSAAFLANLNINLYNRNNNGHLVCTDSLNILNGVVKLVEERFHASSADVSEFVLDHVKLCENVLLQNVLGFVSGEIMSTLAIENPKLVSLNITGLALTVNDLDRIYDLIMVCPQLCHLIISANESAPEVIDWKAKVRDLENSRGLTVGLTIEPPVPL